MILPKYDARDVLAANLERLMADNPELGTRKQLAAKCFWPEGNRKAGKNVSERIIGYVLDRRVVADPYSPSLDLITAFALAFNVPAWQLLVDDKQLRTWMVGKLFSTEDAVSDQHVEKHLPLPPREKSEGDPKRKRSPGPANGDD